MIFLENLFNYFISLNAHKLNANLFSKFTICNHIYYVLRNEKKIICTVSMLFEIKEKKNELEEPGRRNIVGLRGSHQNYYGNSR